MGRTIGRRLPRDIGKTEFVAMCDDCGVHFYRSQLRQMEDGRLSCVGPGTNNDGVGRVELTLSKLNAASSPRRRIKVREGGNYDRDT